MMAQSNYTDKQPSPALSVNLSSNNPFRNRAASPSFASPSSAEFNHAPPRPVSRNPFLDEPTNNMATTNGTLTGNTADLFNNLTLDDKSKSTNGARPSAPRSRTYDRSGQPGSRSENVPPRDTHRPSRSQEEALRARKPGASGSSSRRPPADELDIFADPSDSPRKERRPRRNSDSSAMERPSRTRDEDERRRQERRRRERRHREREGKDKDGKDSKSSSTGKKPDRKLDVIDKLDVTSIYGTGLFHHDGPFDACNPHRNRQGSRRAPMQAFPKDSLNNVLGGSGPLNKRPDHATFMGNHDDEAHKDFSTTGRTDGYGNGAMRVEPPRNQQGEVIDSRVNEVVHGEESMGLGTSTFLDGAPASRTAMQRRETDSSLPGMEGGLQRKKSLAQKIRGISNNRRDFGPSGRTTNPDGAYDTAVVSPGSPYTPGGSKRNEKNPFFDEFGNSTEKKGESITIVEPLDRPGRARAGSSPRDDIPGLSRRKTNEGPPSSYVEPKTSGGFLSRVKSLKGGPRKPREAKPLI